ncbi:MAG: hypothetical protein F4107_08605 [Gemmatimonadetes bacterium]|nr:hypothetical protein [Gemmatimonadota bacterium]MYD13964.1 hypothetical protein [Gemmatimonadota bacterium]MYI65977.1 hypothetical protein [Gemmatimonadota bacterium]
MADVPVWALQIVPGLDLDDTTLKLSGGAHITKPPPDYAYITEEYARATYPEWAKLPGPDEGHASWGTSGDLGPSVLTAAIQQGKARVKLEPTALKRVVFDGTDNTTDGEGKAELSDEVTSGIDVGWEKSTEETLGEKVGVKAEVGPVGGDVEVEHSVSTTVGESQDKTWEVSVGSSDDIEVTVPAGKVQIAVLFLCVGSIEFDVRFFWELTGHTLISPPKGSKEYGHWIYVYPDQLAPYYKGGEAVATISVDFAAEDQIRVITVDSDAQTDIDDAVAAELQKYRDGLKRKVADGWALRLA